MKDIEWRARNIEVDKIRKPIEYTKGAATENKQHSKLKKLKKRSKQKSKENM